MVVPSVSGRSEHVATAGACWRRALELLIVTAGLLLVVPTPGFAEDTSSNTGVDDSRLDAGAATPDVRSGDAPTGTSPTTDDAGGQTESRRDTDSARTPDAASGAETGADAAAPPGSAKSAENHSIEEMKSGDRDHLVYRLVSLFGIVVLVGFAWLLSTNRWNVDWELVAWGIGLQLLFGALIFYAPGVKTVFDYAGGAVSKLLQFSDAGAEFLFDFANPTDGKWASSAKNFAFSILPTIIFFSSLMTILYHLGVMQAIVRAFAKLMRWTMGISGAESLSVSANIFVGQTEAPLVIKPYVEDMTMSELAVVMTGGFATVAGGVLAAYVGMLQDNFPDIAKHLLTASVMSAPAALVIAKVMYPETEEPVTKGDVEIEFESDDANVIDAAARGASEGLDLALNVGAMLLAFLALIAMLNYVIAWPSLQWNLGVLETLATYYRQTGGLTIPEGCTLEAVGTDAVAAHDCASKMAAAASGAPDVWVAPDISLEKIFGYVFWPFAWVMGVPAADCFYIGRLMGEKMVINEFVAYASLSELLASDVELAYRSKVIATYALCGFANFGSIGIQLGGIGGIAPSRQHDLATIALRAMIGGTLAAMMTATVAGVLVT